MRVLSVVVSRVALRFFSGLCWRARSLSLSTAWNVGVALWIVTNTWALKNLCVHFIPHLFLFKLLIIVLFLQFLSMTLDSHEVVFDKCPWGRVFSLRWCSSGTSSRSYRVQLWEGVFPGILILWYFPQRLPRRLSYSKYMCVLWSYSNPQKSYLFFLSLTSLPVLLKLFI